MFKKKNFLENSIFILEKLKPKKKRSKEISFKKIKAEKDFITFIQNKSKIKNCKKDRRLRVLNFLWKQVVLK